MPTSKSSNKSSYSISIPKFSLNNSSYTPILMVVLLIAAFFLGRLTAQIQYLEKGTGTTPAGGVAGAPTVPVPGQKVDVAAGHLPIKGNKDAKVEIIEFSDFQCPFCERWFKDTEANLIKDYVDTGKVKFTYRHFPLTSIHPNAYKASSASECANEQDKFWEYHDFLFNNQTVWANLDNAGAVSKFKEYAGTLGLNTGSFNSCLDSDKYKADIDKDMADAAAAGVNGTPTTFVNGVATVGAVPYETLKQTVDAELAK